MGHLRRVGHRGLWGRGIHHFVAVVGLVAWVLLSQTAATPAEGAEPLVPAPSDEAVAWAYSLPNEVMSPYCPGRTLAACPSPQATELRQWILLQAAAGATRAEVERILYQRFGDDIRQAPRAEGWGLTAWAVPIAGFVVGGLGVVLVLRRMVRPRAEVPPASPVKDGPDSDPELEQVVDRELALLGE